MFQGSMVALVTPMSEDGSLDESALLKLVNFHVDNGTDAIVAVGTTGESATVDVDEHRHIIRKVIEFAKGKMPVIAGTGANSTREAIHLTQCAAEDGADACLLVTPYYNKPTQEGLYQHYKALADAVSIPQILYNVPGRTAVDMLPETVARLCEIDNIVGIKEATGDLTRIQQLLDQTKGHIDIYSGDDATAMESILLGAKGDISVTANVVPRQMAQMCAYALNGDRAAAVAIEAKISQLHTILFVEPNPIPVKWALYQMQLISTGIRLPLTALSPNYHSDLKAALKQADAL